MDQHGGYTAGAGHDLYTARSFPQNYWNRIAFVAEPTGHLVGQFMLEPQRQRTSPPATISTSSPATMNGPRPIAAEVGPDGAVWIIDWYNFIVQHNPIPRGFECGKGGAYETPLRDKTPRPHLPPHLHRRQTVARSSTSKADPEQLVDALKSDNLLWRIHAQRLLVEKAATRQLIPALIELATTNPSTRSA